MKIKDAQGLDLNNVTNTGAYGTTSSTQNQPTAYATIIVYNSGGNVVQTAYNIYGAEYGSRPHIWSRIRVNGEWQSWISINDDIPSFYKDYSTFSALASALGLNSKLVLHDKIYTQLTEDMSTALATKILKEICIQKPGIQDALHVGTFDAGSTGAYIILCYNTSKLDNDGVPQYAWGITFTGGYLALIRSYDYTVSIYNATLT